VKPLYTYRQAAFKKRQRAGTRLRLEFAQTSGNKGRFLTLTMSNFSIKPQYMQDTVTNVIKCKLRLSSVFHKRSIEPGVNKILLPFPVNTGFLFKGPHPGLCRKNEFFYIFFLHHHQKRNKMILCIKRKCCWRAIRNFSYSFNSCQVANPQFFKLFFIFPLVPFCPRFRNTGPDDCLLNFKQGRGGAKK
jgi:hypothetical protein